MPFFGQVWLWSLAGFLVGALLCWALVARPARRRVTELADSLADARRDAARSPRPYDDYDGDDYNADSYNRGDYKGDDYKSDDYPATKTAAPAVLPGFDRAADSPDEHHGDDRDDDRDDDRGDNRGDEHDGLVAPAEAVPEPEEPPAVAPVESTRMLAAPPVGPHPPVAAPPEVEPEWVPVAERFDVSRLDAGDDQPGAGTIFTQHTTPISGSLISDLDHDGSLVDDLDDGTDPDRGHFSDALTPDDEPEWAADPATRYLSPVEEPGEEHAAGALPAHSTPRALPSDSAPGALPADSTPGALPSDNAPGALPSDRAPGTLPSDRAPGALPSDRAPGALPSDSAPGALPKRTPGDADPLPKRTPGEAEPLPKRAAGPSAQPTMFTPAVDPDSRPGRHQMAADPTPFGADNSTEHTTYLPPARDVAPTREPEPTMFAPALHLDDDEPDHDATPSAQHPAEHRDQQPTFTAPRDTATPYAARPGEQDRSPHHPTQESPHRSPYTPGDQDRSPHRPGHEAAAYTTRGDHDRSSHRSGQEPAAYTAPGDQDRPSDRSAFGAPGDQNGSADQTSFAPGDQDRSTRRSGQEAAAYAAPGDQDRSGRRSAYAPGEPERSTRAGQEAAPGDRSNHRTEATAYAAPSERSGREVEATAYAAPVEQEGDGLTPERTAFTPAREPEVATPAAPVQEPQPAAQAPGALPKRIPKKPGDRFPFGVRTGSPEPQPASASAAPAQQQSAREGGSDRVRSLFEPVRPADETAKAAVPSHRPRRGRPSQVLPGGVDTFVPPGPFGPGSAMPLPGGNSPSSEYRVKASVTALRYCSPESPKFDRTVAEVWFRSVADAERVGFRPLA
ncbi:sunset domain-containing protein [Actinokineospora sp. NPDC004072]